MTKLFLNEVETLNLWYLCKTITDYIPEDEYFDEKERKLAETIKEFLSDKEFTAIIEDNPF